MIRLSIAVVVLAALGWHMAPIAHAHVSDPLAGVIW